MRMRIIFLTRLEATENQGNPAGAVGTDVSLERYFQVVFLGEIPDDDEDEEP